MSTLRARIGTAALLGLLSGAGFVACGRADPTPRDATPAPGTGSGTPQLAALDELARAADEHVEKPILVLEEEVLTVQDVPKGTELPGYGVGGGAAGAYGQRFGKGTLVAEGGAAAADDVPLPPADPRAGDDGFVATTGEGLASTFAIDVDTAAYAVVRQTLLRGVRPAPGSVRIE